MSGPLDGITILSLAEQFPGPYATLILADMGANVILVERPSGGDPARAFPDFYNAIARNKQSVALDLKNTEDKDKFLKLVAKADVVLEGFRPGVMERLGLGYETLKQAKPDIIYLSLTGFGQHGPYARRPAHDLSYQAVAGMLAGRAPGSDVSGLAIGDIAGSMFAALSIVVAIVGRLRTGGGTSIDLSLTDSLVSWLTYELGPAANGGERISVAEEPGYGIFICQDGQSLTLSIAHEDHFWRILSDLLGLGEDIASLSHGQRVKQRLELQDRLAAAIKGHSLAHWAALFEAHSLPWGPVQFFEDVISDPHFLSREMFTDPGAFDTVFVNQPVRFSAYETGVRTGVPELGEHNDLLLQP